MAGRRNGRWMMLVVTIWIQAFTGTNFDFSSYSTEMKAVMGISQLQLNYLAVASDLGKAFGWSSGLALLYFPLHVVLFVAAGVGLLSYGLQWALLIGLISMSYSMVFVLCLLAGLSICWFNTTCFVLCIRNFTTDRALALSLTTSYNAISPALYTLAANSLNTKQHSPPSSYLLLNATLPFLASILALIPILTNPQSQQHPPAASDRPFFLALNTIAFLTAVFLLFPNHISPKINLSGALILLAFPLVFVARSGSDEVELREKLIVRGRVGMVGEENGVRRLFSRVDFWLYYVAYLCGGTVGLVYSNNLGQIAQSLGRQTEISMLVNVYSSCSFFGRLVSAAPDILPWKKSFARTGYLAAAIVPMPLVFYIMAKAEDGELLLAGTALIGLSSGFICASAVSVTSELFGPSSFGVNHNIVITNIPLGSLLYGLLAALVYDANGTVGVCEAVARLIREGMVVCMGARCYGKTFLVWGCASTLGLACSVALYLRTRAAYRCAAER